MQIRRCAVVYVEPREDLRFALDALLAGQPALRSERRWLALLPHRQAEVELDEEMLQALTRVSAEQWTAREALGETIAEPVLERLLAQGLLLVEGDAGAHAQADERLRRVGWHPLYATAHLFGRWRDVDSPALARDAGLSDLDELLRRLGEPPPTTIERGDTAATIALPTAAPTALDELLSRRATCRNFDPAAAVALPELAAILHRVFAAQAVHTLRPGHSVLRKTSPSGGCLHPIEVHVLAQRVGGLPCGLYHYRPAEHRLAPMAAPAAADLAAINLRGLAGQHWFARAAVSLILSCRFDRHYWKYRQHAKAYRAMMFDAGHLSQTLYLSAAERGLGAFVTAAINEQPLEEMLGLDALAEGVIAVCGLGPRAATREEFDFADGHSPALADSTPLP